MRFTLWFDVGVKRYTTSSLFQSARLQLWFDVGVKRYTTEYSFSLSFFGCGLM